MTFSAAAAAVALALVTPACRKEAGPPSVSGTIETDEVHVASRYGGRVLVINAWEGAVLTNGQVIVELDAAELRSQRDRVAAELAEATAGPRSQEIAAARAEWEAQVSELDLARLEAKRALELFAQRTISETERDQTVSRAASLEKNVAAGRARYDLLLAGTRPERLAQASARLAEIETQLREMRVLAPGPCVLEVLGVKVGDVLAPNREVATLLLTEHTWIRVYVPQPWLGAIQLGQKVKLAVDAFPSQSFEGEVEQISRNAEFTPRNVQTPGERVKQVFAVKVRLKNERLRAGMSADVFFPGIDARLR